MWDINALAKFKNVKFIYIYINSRKLNALTVRNGGSM